MLCIKYITWLHVSYGLWIRWVISHAPYSHCRERLSFSAPIYPFLWNFQLFCQVSLPNFVRRYLADFVRRYYPKLDDTLKSMCQIRDVITSSVSFTFRENEFAADNKASLPFQLLSNIFIFLCCFFREYLWNRNQSRMISLDWLNTFRIYFHANRALVHWALRMPLWMNILLVMTK